MARPIKNIRNSSLLNAALEGLELQKQRIEEQIREVRALLGKGTGRRGRPPGSTKHKGGGRLSDAARKRIAAAQKRRWAEYRKSASGKAE
jgi:hypothetical protein